MKFKVGDRIKTLPAIDEGWEPYNVKPLSNMIGKVVHVDHPDDNRSGFWPYRVELVGHEGASYLVDDTEITLLDVEG